MYAQETFQKPHQSREDKLLNTGSITISDIISDLILRFSRATKLGRRPHDDTKHQLLLNASTYPEIGNVDVRI